MAIRADPGLETRNTFFLCFLLDTVDPAQLLINIVPGQVSIDLEHRGMHRPPHHHLDHTFRDSFVDEMSDPGVAEEVRCDMLRNPSPLTYAAKLFDDPAVGEWSPLLIEEDQCVSFWDTGIISPPLGEISLHHDDPDISGNPGLEVHIGDHAGAIKGEIAPLHLAKLTDTEASLIEHPDKGPVPAPAAGRQEGFHLFWCEEVRGLVGHGVLGRDLDATDLPLRKIGIFVLDHPENELPENPDPIVLGILLEWRAFLSETVLHCVNAGIDIGDREILIGTYEPPPSDQDIDELVCPAGANVCSDLSLGYELLDEISITFGDPVRCQSCIDRMHPILGFDT